MTIAALSPSFCPAKSMPLERKKRAALEAISQKKTITELADEYKTSRKFVRQQGRKAQAAIDNVFHLEKAGNDGIYYLPVTKTWIAQLVLELMFLGHASYRNIVMMLKDLLDYDISLGSIHNIFVTPSKKRDKLMPLRI